MLFEKIESVGLAHYSYIIGHNSEALVIDPRRDCNIYIEKAVKKGYKIKHILETHRNEDYLIGSVELADRTGASIWHADSQWDYKYGEPVEDGQKFRVGRLKIKAIHSPGHTPGSMSYLLHDPDNEPWILFSGDALFAGDVGRVDLLGMDKSEEMAEMLYDTIFNKFLPLGDEILLCPAHGSGSVCGSGIAERVWSTIGLERKNNPKLQSKNRNEFIKLVARKLERPPYFRKMEKYNLEGAPVLGHLPVPEPLNPGEFEGKAENSFILDNRMELGFGGAHINDAQSIWMDGIPSFAGWFIPYEKPLLLVGEDEKMEKTLRYLMRIGYDEIEGFLSGGMLSWHMAGKNSDSIDLITVQELCGYLDRDKRPFILDVRSSEELNNNGEIPGAVHIHITQLPEKYDEIPKNEKIFVFCGSGLRSMIGASYLKKNGWNDIAVILGGLSGWNSATCPVDI